jgi:hypothetical protein
MALNASLTGTENPAPPPNWAELSPMLYPYLQQLHHYPLLHNGMPTPNGSNGGPRFPFDFNAAAAGMLGPKMPFIVEDDGVKDNPQVELEDKDLWDQFSDCTNEISC